MSSVIGSVISTFICKTVEPPPSHIDEFSSSLSDPFNDWKGRGCNKFVPVLGGNDTKIVPTGDIFDQTRGQMR